RLVTGGFIYLFAFNVGAQILAHCPSGLRRKGMLLFRGNVALSSKAGRARPRSTRQILRGIQRESFEWSSFCPEKKHPLSALMAPSSCHEFLTSNSAPHYH